MTNNNEGKNSGASSGLGQAANIVKTAGNVKKTTSGVKNIVGAVAGKTPKGIILKTAAKGVAKKAAATDPKNPLSGINPIKRARERAKKRRKRILKIKLLKLKIKIIAWVTVAIGAVLSTVCLFLIANPAILATLVAIQLLSSSPVGQFFLDTWETIESAFDYCVNVFGSILGLSEMDENDQAQGFSDDSETGYVMGDFNANDEYKDSMLKSYDLCQEAAKKAFKLAKNDAEAQAEALGYGGFLWFDNFKIVNKRGETARSWKDVYKTTPSSEGAKDGINWGDLIVALDLCYGEENGKDENGDVLTTDYDPNDLETYILEEDNLKCLYHIRVVPDPEDDEKALAIIEPYDYFDLYSMANIRDEDGNSRVLTPDDMYDENTSFADAAAMKLRQMREVLSTDEPYEKLGLENETPVNVDREEVEIPDLDTGNITIDNPEGNSNRDKIWNALIEAGYTEMGAAGVMGNLWAENSFRTTWAGDQGSVGLAQWREGRKTALVNLANEKGLDPTDINLQIAYLIQYDCPAQLGDINERTNNTYYTDLLNATDIVAAADIFCARFERPSNYYARSGWEHGKYGPDTSVEGYQYYIDWSRYVYSDAMGKYYLDLKKRRDYAQTIYNTYHQ